MKVSVFPLLMLSRTDAAKVKWRLFQLSLVKVDIILDPNVRQIWTANVP